LGVRCTFSANGAQAEGFLLDRRLHLSPSRPIYDQAVGTAALANAYLDAPFTGRGASLGGIDGRRGRIRSSAPVPTGSRQSFLPDEEG